MEKQRKLIIKINNVEKFYYKFSFKKFFFELDPVLKNISFEIFERDCIGIIGKNGAGKTTLLKIISKVLKPSNGFVESKSSIHSLLNLNYDKQ